MGFYLVTYCQPSPLTRFLPITAIGMCHFLPVHHLGMVCLAGSKVNIQHLGMDFGIEKYAVLVMKSGKRHLTDGIELPNQDKIRMHAENETYKYLGILEADTIKQVEMKDKIQKEYLRRTRKLLETKLSCRNLIKGINTWAVPLV